MQAKEIKNGTIVNYNGAPCLIESTTVQSPTARGAATFYKYRARNLITKQKVDITLRGGESLDAADFRKRPIKFMYADATHLHFLDQEDYNQYALTKEDAAEEVQYLTEELEGAQALIYNDECVGIQLPVAVELTVVECDPAIKGASATSRSKPAKLQTGLIVQVPEYLAAGERIKVDTRDGSYLSRA
jgi:elongation factor P